MLFNILVVAVSLLLMVYWFRYTCLLMLRTQPERDYAKQIAAANHLSVVNIQSRLTVSQAQPLDELARLLDRDYRLLMYLNQHAANFKTAGYEIDQVILRFDYLMMKRLYRVSRFISPQAGAARVAEMAAIVMHLADKMGERAALAAAQ